MNTPADSPSKTPRSDALISLAESHGEKAVELLAFGLRQLETELIAAKESASHWKSEAESQAKDVNFNYSVILQLREQLAAQDRKIATTAP